MKYSYRNILYQIYYITLFIALISSFLLLLDSVIHNDKSTIYPWDFAMLLAIFISVHYTR